MEQLQDVSHAYIRYANCWEDADCLLEGLALKPGSKVLSIASAGDNSLSLLVTNPELVVAVDVNPVQLHLVELKMAAIRALSLAEVKSFLGFLPHDNRVGLYARVADFLPENARKFWDARPVEIHNGIVSQGKFERYFLLFSGKVLPMIHNRKRVEELFRKKSAEEQAAFFNEQWNSRRWRLLFRVFFSKFVMGRLGRDPAFLQEVEVSVADFIFGKAATHLASPLAQDNPFLQFILTGQFRSMPHYLREENFDKIRNNLDRLVLHEGLAESAIEQYGPFSGFNLSNIFEYMNPEVCGAVADQLAHGATPGARLAYWNLMVPRRLSEVRPTAFQYHESLSQDLTARDRGFFYNRLLIEERL